MNFVQQIGDNLRSVDLGQAIGSSGFRTIDLIILVVYLVVLVALGLSSAALRKVRRRVQMITSLPETLLPGGLSELL
jgi:hypothetical protein